MKDAILYVYYSSPCTCSRRIRLMRTYNIGVPFYGICTDIPERQQKYAPVHEVLDDNWVFPHVSPLWHWHNLDKVVCRWYTERGNTLSFDRLLVLDWDAMLMCSVAGLVGEDGECGARFIRVWANANPEENHWTKRTNAEFSGFCAKYQAEKGGNPELHNAFLFAYTISRSALDLCAADLLGYPGYCEYRLPTLLRGHGCVLGEFPRPANAEHLVNVNGRSISRSVIRGEMARPDGYRLFHPVYEPYQDDHLNLGLYDRVAEGCLYRTLSRKAKDLIKRGRRMFAP